MKNENEQKQKNIGSCPDMGSEVEGSCCWKHVGSSWILQSNDCAEGYCCQMPKSKGAYDGQYVRTICRPITPGSTDCGDV